MEPIRPVRARTPLVLFGGLVRDADVEAVAQLGAGAACGFDFRPAPPNRPRPDRLRRLRERFPGTLWVALAAPRGDEPPPPELTALLADGVFDALQWHAAASPASLWSDSYPDWYPAFDIRAADPTDLFVLEETDFLFSWEDDAPSWEGEAGERMFTWIRDNPERSWRVGGRFTPASVRAFLAESYVRVGGLPHVVAVHAGVELGRAAKDATRMAALLQGVRELSEVVRNANGNLSRND